MTSLKTIPSITVFSTSVAFVKLVDRDCSTDDFRLQIRDGGSQEKTVMLAHDFLKKDERSFVPTSSSRFPNCPIAICAFEIGVLFRAVGCCEIPALCRHLHDRHLVAIDPRGLAVVALQDHVTCSNLKVSSGLQMLQRVARSHSLAEALDSWSEYQEVAGQSAVSVLSLCSRFSSCALLNSACFIASSKSSGSTASPSAVPCGDSLAPLAPSPGPASARC